MNRRSNKTDYVAMRRNEGLDLGHSSSTCSINLSFKGISGLRILHVIDYIFPILGYQETFLAEVHSRANETLVITSDRYTKVIYDANKHLLGKQIVGAGLFKEAGLNVLRLPTRVNLDFLNTPWLIGLEKAVTSFNPDVIIAHGLINFTSIKLAMLKQKLPKSKLIFDDHMTYNATRGGWTNLFYRLFSIIFTPLFLKSAKTFVAVTPETKTFMHKMYGIPKERIIIIPLGISMNNFNRDLQARNLIREKYGIRNSDVVFIYAGKIMREKGVHIFVEAALKVAETHYKVRFMIVGGKDPSYLAYLKQRIARSNKENLFSFIDAVPNRELHNYYSAADVGVWPLQCSVAMLEAAACGLPIIISDKCGAPERASAGNGLLYRESDAADLARKFVLLLDEGKRKQMSEKAIAFAKTLDWNDLAERFLKVQ
jgi:glycosyltransferase involved in cell wall biosynthesis